MKERVTKKVLVVSAKYVEEANSIVLVCQDENGNKFRNQIHKSCFSYDNLNEEQINFKLNKISRMLIGKKISLVFDPPAKNE